MRPVTEVSAPFLSFLYPSLRPHRRLPPQWIIATLHDSIPAANLSRTPPVPHSSSHRTFHTTRPHPARRTTKLKLSDLPTAISAPPPPPLPPDPPPKYPPLLQTVLSVIEAYPNALVLTRVGGFYEGYFEAATELNQVFGIKVTKKRTVRSDVLLAGFPWTQLERYLKVLVREYGREVVVVDEFLNEFGAIERRVSRVFTPGTYLEDEDGNGTVNMAASGAGRNWIMSVGSGACCWADLATGECFYMSGEVGREVERVAPVEVLVDEKVWTEVGEMLVENAGRGGWVVKSVNTLAGEETWESVFDNPEDISLTNQERMAMSLLLAYLRDHFCAVQPKLQTPVRWKTKDTMLLDAAALSALEILKTGREGSLKGSLLHTIRKTVTVGGRRFLGDWIVAPLMDVEEIEKRLDIVETLVRDQGLRYNLTAQLKQCSDLSRLLQVLAMGKGDVDTLLSIKRTIETSEEIARVVTEALGKKNGMVETWATLKGPKIVKGIIGESVDEEAVMQRMTIDDQEEKALKEIAAVEAAELSELEEVGTGEVDVEVEKKVSARAMRVKRTLQDEMAEEREKDVFVMKRGTSRHLQQFHSQLDNLFEEKEKMTSELRQQLGARNLWLRYTPAYGHHLHLRNKDAQIPLHDLEHRPITSSRATKNIHYSPWAYLGTQIESLRLAIRKAEDLELHRMRTSIMCHASELRILATGLARLDVLQSFATVAIEQAWTRPKFTTTEGTKTELVDVSHPCLPQTLTPVLNTLVFSPPNARTLILTGPNTSGKSTLLRATALCTILAQTGSFVPCSSMLHSPIDAIYTRINSADNLQAAKSRFTAELQELNSILNRATSHSLILLDEPITSTDPPSALALTYASLYELHTSLRVGRILLATHLLPLYNLLKNVEGIEWWRTGIWEEEGGRWGFKRRIERGVADGSEALRVAAAAGVGVEILKRAEGVREGKGWGGGGFDDGGKMGQAEKKTRKRGVRRKEVKMEEVGIIRLLRTRSGKGKGVDVGEGE